MLLESDYADAGAKPKAASWLDDIDLTAWFRHVQAQVTAPDAEQTDKLAKIYEQAKRLDGEFTDLDHDGSGKLSPQEIRDCKSSGKAEIQRACSFAEENYDELAALASGEYIDRKDLDVLKLVSNHRLEPLMQVIHKHGDRVHGQTSMLVAAGGFVAYGGLGFGAGLVLGYAAGFPIRYYAEKSELNYYSQKQKDVLRLRV